MSATAAPPSTAAVRGPVAVEGKQLTRGGRRLRLRGVGYGTFAPWTDGTPYPDPATVHRDVAAIKEAGFTAIRTYTEPPERLLEAAREHDVLLMSDTFFPDWRYMLGCSRREVRRIARDARATVRAAARRLAGDDQVMALLLGNEIPADVIRFLGTRTIASFISELTEVVHEEDPDRLVSYANYPTAEYLPLDSLDFLTFNVFLESQTELHRYLTHLQHVAGDRPLVLGEFGLHAGPGEMGERRQAEVLDWQMETLVERGVAGGFVFTWTDDWAVGGLQVEDWNFGLTRRDRSPRPALGVAERWNRRQVADLDFDWPSISVVVCAYNAEGTIDECLRHLCAIDYPGLEVLVIDDGSGDATADLARRHQRARVITVPHAGLAVARNVGLVEATGDLVAYLDSDAYPAPEWPWYLALGMDGPDVAGTGGPNFPPLDDPPGAARVARAPGGPVHVLMSPERAEHVPGCNMAFWRDVLLAINGFDPVFTAAGDDVDICWRVLDAGWQIGFHPAAMVWHHRRGGVRAYARQQRGYGISETQVAARHPDRFTTIGTARWRGSAHDAFAPRELRQRIYRGPFGAAAFQGVYRGGGTALDLIHQIGVPLSAAAAATAPLGLVKPFLAGPAIAAALFVAALWALDIARVRAPRTCPKRHRLFFRGAVAFLHILQPVVRAWGRLGRRSVRREQTASTPRPHVIRCLSGGVLLLEQDQPREQVAAMLLEAVRRTGVRAIGGNGWEPFDGRLLVSWLLAAELITSSHPVGYVQARLRPVGRRTVVVAAAFAATVSLVTLPGAVAVAALAAVDLVIGWRRCRRLLLRALAERPSHQRAQHLSPLAASAE